MQRFNTKKENSKAWEYHHDPEDCEMPNVQLNF